MKKVIAILYIVLLGTTGTVYANLHNEVPSEQPEVSILEQSILSALEDSDLNDTEKKEIFEDIELLNGKSKKILEDLIKVGSPGAESSDPI